MASRCASTCGLAADTGGGSGLCAHAAGRALHAFRRGPGLPLLVRDHFVNLPAYVPQAFIAVEDKRFYEHDGVDVKAVGAAIVGRVWFVPEHLSE